MATRQRRGTAHLDDGTAVAYAVTGSGPPLVVVPGWLSHLELGWSLPAERMLHEALSQGRTLVRYDRPGCGLSGAYDGPRTLDLELATVDAVLADLGAGPVDLLGWSLGAAVAARWAAEHPASVERLVLYGGWVRGREIGDEDSRRHVLGLLATHWGLGSDLLTDLFAPDADAGTRRAQAQYQRSASSSATAVALLELAYDLDVTDALPRVLAPTLVLHRDGDRAAPIAQGRALAAGIPGARLVELEGRSHLPAMGDADALVAEVRRFLGLQPLRRAVPTGLTPRQAEVAALVAAGLANREIAARLGITERSARVPPGADPAAARLPLPRADRRLVGRAGAVVPRLRGPRPTSQHRRVISALRVLGWIGFNLVMVWAVLFLADVVVPRTVDGPVRVATPLAVTTDLLLLLLFGLQHSVMARRTVKAALRSWVPVALERTTFVLATDVCLALVFALWQPVGGEVWRVDGVTAVVMWTLCAAGWALAVAATYAVDHRELTGLRPPGPDGPLQVTGLYGVVRHPLMTGLLLAFWATPHLGASHLLFAVAATGYVAVGIAFEERDLRRTFGAAYDAYAAAVPALVPGAHVIRRWRARRVGTRGA